MFPPLDDQEKKRLDIVLGILLGMLAGVIALLLVWAKWS